MGLFRGIAKILVKFSRWKLTTEIPKEIKRCVFVFAPHTSNWDWYFGTITMVAWGVPIKVVIKKSWTKFPLSLVIKPLGGVGIERKANPDGTKRNQVQLLADIFKKHEEIAMIIAPEGTRSKTDQWKTGFYHVAQAANVPIVSFTGDNPTRKIKFGKVFYPGADKEEVMKYLMGFFSSAQGVNPENFTVDKRYV